MISVVVNNLGRKVSMFFIIFVNGFEMLLIFKEDKISGRKISSMR